MEAGYRVPSAALMERRSTRKAICSRAVQIEGASALVVGGASGLGAATARALHAAGASVVIADLNAEKGDALAGERIALLGIEVGDHHGGAGGVQGARGRRPQAGGAPHHQSACTLDLHGAGAYVLAG